MKRERRASAKQADEKRQSWLKEMNEEMDEEELGYEPKQKKRRTSRKSTSPAKGSPVKSPVITPDTPSTTTKLDDLPLDCIHEIASFVDEVQFLRLPFVSKMFYAVFTLPEANELWANCIDHFYPKSELKDPAVRGDVENKLEGFKAFDFLYNHCCFTCGAAADGMIQYSCSGPNPDAKFTFRGPDKVVLCSSCDSEGKVITKTDAKKQYGLNDEDIAQLPSRFKYHRFYKTQMTLLPKKICNQATIQKHKMTPAVLNKKKREIRLQREKKRAEELQKRRERKRAELEIGLKPHGLSIDTIEHDLTYSYIHYEEISLQDAVDRILQKLFFKNCTNFNAIALNMSILGLQDRYRQAFIEYVADNKDKPLAEVLEQVPRSLHSVYTSAIASGEVNLPYLLF